MKRIGLHTCRINNAPARISTIQLCADEFETMVMFDYGEEIECFRTTNIEDARKMHNKVMRRWNDRLYEASIAKVLGFENYGQFVHPVVKC